MCTGPDYGTGPTAGIGFNATRPTVPPPIAGPNPPQPARIGHPAPDRCHHARLAGIDDQATASPQPALAIPSTDRTEATPAARPPDNLEEMGKFCDQDR